MTKKGIDWKEKQSKKVIKAALKRWPKKSMITFTGGKDSMVMLYLIKMSSVNIPPSIFIDHKLHFDETYEFVKKIKKDWKIKIDYVNDRYSLNKLMEEKSVVKRRELSRILKIKTIDQEIKKNNWKAMFVGIRWDEHPARSNEKFFSKRKNHYRIHPILHFTEADIWEYIRKYKVPYNPLYDQGYRSVGEKDFTKPVLDKDSPERAGREKDKEQIMERLRKLGYF